MCGPTEFVELLHPKESFIPCGALQDQNKSFGSRKSHSALSQRPSLFFLPQLSPCGEAAEFVLDDKPDHKGELCGFGLFERVVCVLRYGQDYYITCRTHSLSDTLIQLRSDTMQD